MISPNLRERAEEIASHIFRWGANSSDMKIDDFREERLKAVKQLEAALTSVRNEALEEAAKVAANRMIVMYPQENIRDEIATAIRNLIGEGSK